jgi:tRNA U34 5-carboxymethylaminomethyl modifying GTPase MnmE/TrmE
LTGVPAAGRPFSFGGCRMCDRDTICALATPPGRGAIAVVRLSGPRAHAVLAAVGGAAPADRTMRLRRVRAADGAVIDEGLAVAFPGDSGPTGEPYAELHLHGGVDRHAWRSSPPRCGR